MQLKSLLPEIRRIFSSTNNLLLYLSRKFRHSLKKNTMCDVAVKITLNVLSE